MLTTMVCDPEIGNSETMLAGLMPEFSPMKKQQQATWASGDFAVIGVTLQIVGEELCEAMDLRAGQQVLDVAAGNGNAALAAARRWCDVTASDYVPALLEQARERARGERLPLKTKLSDAEALSFADNSFDAVTSTFGAMFTPDHEKPACEMLRVCRSGGKIGMANWTPNGFIGELFKVISGYLPPPTGMKSPALWGTPDHIEELFGARGTCSSRTKEFVMRYRSDRHWLEIFKRYYGPVLKAYERLDASLHPALDKDIRALIAEFNMARDGTMVVPSEYLQAVVVKH